MCADLNANSTVVLSIFRYSTRISSPATSNSYETSRPEYLLLECHKPRQSPAPGFGEKYWSLSGFPSHSLESGGSVFDCNIWPNFRGFGIQRQPFLKPGFAIDDVGHHLLRVVGTPQMVRGVHV